MQIRKLRKFQFEILHEQVCQQQSLKNTTLVFCVVNRTLTSCASFVFKATVKTNERLL